MGRTFGVTAEVEPRFLVQVIDNGPEVEDPERIFDAFVTTTKTGMGIGLGKSLGIHSHDYDLLTFIPSADYLVVEGTSKRVP